MGWWPGKSAKGKRGRDRYVVVLSLGGDTSAGGQVFRLGPGEQTIGRDDSSTIQVVDPHISRQHLLIEYQPASNTYIVRDLDTANGTRINGELMVEPRLLTEEDLIEIGGTQLLFTGRQEGQLRGLQDKRFSERRVETMQGDRAASRTDEADQSPESR